MVGPKLGLLLAFDVDRSCGAIRSGHAIRGLEGRVRSSLRLRARDDAYQDFLGVAYPPSKVEDVAIGLHHFGCQFDTEPVLRLEGNGEGGGKVAYI